MLKFKNHETLELDVVGYIDSTNVVDKCIEGWCHYKDENIVMRIKYSNGEIVYETDQNSYIDVFCRQDVVEYYKNTIKKPFGFKINNLKSDCESLEIQILVDDGDWKTIFNIVLVSCDSTLNEKQMPNIVIIDNVYKNPDSVRFFALEQKYNYHEEYHKGLRTESVYKFDGLKDLFEKKLGTKILNWNLYKANGCFQYCTSKDALVYHTDLQDYAAIIFLTPNAPPQCGTTIYRSIHTKKTSITGDEFSIVFKNGFYDSTEFEIVDVIGNIYNRAVIFNGRLFHAASKYFGTTLENSRLFQIFFFDVEK